VFPYFTEKVTKTVVWLFFYSNCQRR